MNFIKENKKNNNVLGICTIVENGKLQIYDDGWFGELFVIIEYTKIDSDN